MTTPTIDIFTTRAMLAALEMMLPPKTFLLDTFFSETNQSDTEYVDIDIIRHKRRLAPFVIPVAEGKLLERQKYDTKTVKPPYIKPKMQTQAADLLTRNMGSSIYETQPIEQRAAARLARDMQDLQNSITRRQEWMASQALTTGTIPIVGEGVNATISFGAKASHQVVLAGNALWSNYTAAPVSDPLANLRAWKRQCAQDSGLVPDVAVFGYSVVDTFLGHPGVQNYLNNRRIFSAQVDVSLLPDGVTYIGRVEDLDIYEYDEWYVRDSDNTEQPMIPSNLVILGSTRARAIRQYGAILDLDAGGIAALNYFPKSWRTPDPSVQWVMLQSAPLTVPHQIDSFLYAQVI